MHNQTSARRFGVSVRAVLPAEVAAEFREACESLGVAYKDGFAALVGPTPEGGKAKWSRDLKGRVMAGIAASERFSKPSVTLRFHIPEEHHRKLAEAGIACEVWKTITDARRLAFAQIARTSAFVMMAHSGYMRETIAASMPN